MPRAAASTQRNVIKGFYAPVSHRQELGARANIVTNVS